MPTILNSTKTAEAIEAATGRQCSRQNLEKLCDKGALQGSPCILQRGPWRFDADLAVQEYLAKVAPFQAEAQQPAAIRRPSPSVEPSPSSAAAPFVAARAATTRRRPAQLPSDAPDDLPDYTVSRARSEYEKANLLELQRMTQEGLLLRREDVEQAWGRAVNLTRTRLLGVPSTAKQRIPHLDVEEVELLMGLIREALEELAAGEVTA